MAARIVVHKRIKNNGKARRKLVKTRIRRR